VSIRTGQRASTAVTRAIGSQVDRVAADRLARTRSKRSASRPGWADATPLFRLVAEALAWCSGGGGVDVGWRRTGPRPGAAAAMASTPLPCPRRARSCLGRPGPEQRQTACVVGWVNACEEPLAGAIEAPDARRSRQASPRRSRKVVARAHGKARGKSLRQKVAAHNPRRRGDAGSCDDV